MGIARSIAERLIAGLGLSRQHLKRLMTQTFGCAGGWGDWSMRDAYDALELGQVLALLDPAFVLIDEANPEATFQKLASLAHALPTQTYRSDSQVDLQQFSTPLPLAWLAAYAARLDANDIVLEPSAGTGMLAVYARRVAAGLILNERDPHRAALLAAALGEPVALHDAEFIDDLLTGSGRPSVVLINPPFGRSETRGRDRHAGARHLRSALLRLAPGGRCVAIMPPSFERGGTGASGYEAVAALVPPRVEITIAGNPYAKHGTSIDVRLIVFDKGWTGPSSETFAKSLDAALPAVLAVPDRLPRDSPPPPTAPIPARALPALGAARPLFQALLPSALTPPVRRSAANSNAAPLDYKVLETPRPSENAAGIYVPWRLARIAFESATPHPDELVESVAMTSVLPPAPTYQPLLQDRATSALSDAQLETIILAGEAFERDLPGRFRPNEAGDLLIETEAGNVYRTGFFIGDGTGVGKGREVAGCILDQWNRGRRKAVWISKSSTLIEDARRDWAALGGLPIDIQPLDAFPFGTRIEMQSGILFLTYATLRSSRHDALSRLQQILDWLGLEFDGMIVFDEAHAMGRAAGTETEHGPAEGSLQGLAGVRLQHALPRARVLYVSATGATDPSNLCYAARLGLWGPGTAFNDRDGFMAAMEAGGIAAMEIVARDLKAMGLYTARALSFAGVEYEALEHQLTSAQIEIYDAYADAWAIIHVNLEEAMRATNICDRMSGDTLNGQARGAALSRFESAKQRFFGQVLLSMKTPTLINAIDAELATGHAAVVQLVTTAEAILDRRLAALSPEDRADLDLDLSPRDYMIDYLKNAFPTRMMRVFHAADGAMRSEIMIDETGNPVHCREAMAAREDLIERLCAMPPIPAALDALIAHFGTDRVAEVTGRSRRIIVTAGRQKLERRGARANLAETDAFLDGVKPILVFSDAGGTGRSYHSDLGCKSADRRRVHFLLEPGWRAAAAIQGLGRTHRTNQASPPIFRPVTTDCKGERRFISTIARRLDSLGALTRGQRQTGGQNLFDPADNLESDYARDALNQWYHLLYEGKLTSTNLDTFQAMTGLKLVEGEGGGLLERLPPIQRWLNRILALRIATQNAIFEEFLGLIQARVDAAREAGTLDVGVEMIAAERMSVLDDQLLRRDPRTGAETRLQRLELHLRRNVTSFQRLMATWGTMADKAYLKNARSGRVALQVPSWSITDDEGRPVPMCQLIRPTGSQRIQEAALWHGNWAPIAEDKFEALWEVEAAEGREALDIETICVATGLLLPVWHRLPSEDVRVWRIAGADGTTILGRIVPPAAMEKLGAEFGLEASMKLSPEELIEAAASTEGALLPGLGEARLIFVRVNDDRRLEIRSFPHEKRTWLKSLGCFVEIIAFKSRLFVPLKSAKEIVSAIIEDPTKALGSAA
jgi:hypothetical protein